MLSRCRAASEVPRVSTSNCPIRRCRPGHGSRWDSRRDRADGGGRTGCRRRALPGVASGSSGRRSASSTERRPSMRRASRSRSLSSGSEFLQSLGRVPHLRCVDRHTALEDAQIRAGIILGCPGLEDLRLCLGGRRARPPAVMRRVSSRVLVIGQSHVPQPDRDADPLLLDSGRRQCGRVVERLVQRRLRRPIDLRHGLCGRQRGGLRSGATECDGEQEMSRGGAH